MSIPKRRRRKAIGFCFIILFLLSLHNSGLTQISATLSTNTLKAGNKISIKGTISPDEELSIVIASETIFSSEKTTGSKEKAHLLKDGEKFGFTPTATIPYLYYIITSNPESYGEVVNKSYGFRGIYRTKMFKLKKWEDISDLNKSSMGPVKTENQWNFIRYTHEEPFGVDTIVKEKTCKGRVVIFSRSVVSDYENQPMYWNEGTSISLDKSTGNFSATFKTFKHSPPNAKFEVYVNGENIGSYVATKPGGLWLPLGWRYVNPLIIIVGAIVAGTFYSMVGACGGLLMAAFQVLLVHTAAPLGINAANVLKSSNLPLVIFASLAALVTYAFKEHRLAIPIAAVISIGVFLGSFVVGPSLSAKYLNMAVYKPWLALVMIIMVVRTLYEMTPRMMEKRRSIKAITQKFDAEVKKAKKEGRAAKMGYTEITKFNLFACHFRFWGEEFKINIILVFFVGFLIGIIGAAFGIGGGFLFVPAMTILGGLPMYLAVPISLVASAVTGIAGMAGYAMIGYFPDIWIVISIIIGALAGGAMGSRLHSRFSEKQLKWILAIVLLFLALRFAEIEIWI